MDATTKELIEWGMLLAFLAFVYWLNRRDGK
jgi:hypothetical protein